jgi:MFS family permease
LHRVSTSANPGFPLLLAGNVVSAFGNSLFLVGLMLYFSTRLVSPLYLGIAQAAAFVPVLFLGYAGGAAADTWSRPCILAGADMLRGLALAAAAILLPRAEILGETQAFFLLLGLVALMGAAQAFFQPAVVSLVTDMSRPGGAGTRDLLALRTASNHLASLAGQGLGGLALVFLGFPLLMLANGAGFFLSGLSELLIPESRTSRPEEPAPPPVSGRRPPVRAVVAELLRLNREGAALDLFLLQQFIFPFLAVTLPFFLQYRLALGRSWVGFTFAALFAGSIGTALLRSRKGAAAGAGSAGSVYAAGLLGGVTILAASFLRAGGLSFLVLPGAVMLGAVVGRVYLHSVGFVQRKGESSARGRRHGVLEAVSNGMTPAAYLLGGLVVQGLPLDSPLVYCVAGGLMAVFSLTRLLRIEIMHGT